METFCILNATHNKQLKRSIHITTLIASIPKPIRNCTKI